MPSANDEQMLSTSATAASPDALILPDVRTILIYASLTAVSLLLLIFTTRALGQAPLLLLGGNSPPFGWQPITDSQLQFTLNLPETWHTVDLTSSPEADNIKNLAPVQLLNASFGMLVADSELLLMADETAVSAADTSVFILVAHSKRLQLLSADQFLLYAQDQFPESFQITETEIVDSEWGLSKGNILFDMQQADNQWRCQEQFVPTEEDAYLITGCARSTQFTDYAADFGIILRSFQPLDS